MKTPKDGNGRPKCEPPKPWSQVRPFAYHIDFEKGFIRRRMLEALDIKP